MPIRRLTIGFVLAAAALHLAAGLAAAQARPAGDDKGLMGLIPREAFLFIERRGHTAIRGPFLASNLGKMAQDEVIKQFVHDTRVRIGELICKQMFDLTDRAEIARHQKLLHGLLKPFWYQPCAMFLVLGEKGNRTPQLGFLCLTGRYKQECLDSLAALMKIGVPPKGTAGERQAFGYEKSAVVWQGVAKGGKEWSLPADAQAQRKALEGKSLFMTSWTGRTLCVTTGLKSADALSSMLSLTQRGPSVLEIDSLATVTRKTALRDWAFRWFVDVKALLALLKAEDADLEAAAMLAALGVDKVLGMGGTGGYADNVFVRKTYVHAPQATRGLLRMFRRGGAYQKAHAMAPDTSSFCLAAQMDLKIVARMIRDIGAAQTGDADRRRAVIDTQPAAAPKPRLKKAAPKLDEETAKVLAQIDLLAEASDGNVCGFVTDLQGVMGMAMGGGPPLGAVLGLKDHDQAVRAIEALMKLAGADRKPNAGEQPKGPDAPKRLETYRKVKIRRLGEAVGLAVMKDRVILAANDSALKAAIDAARDGTGGFAPNSAGPKLTKLAGEGSALFVMDLAAAAKAFWPMLVDLAGKARQRGEDFPFASVPSAGKMVRLLGPEVAVLRPDEDGLMMSSRGKIPFATKAVFGYPFGMLYFVFAMRW